MNDLDQSELLTQILEPSTAKTAELTGVLPCADKNNEDFRAGQGRIIGMMAANAPLSEILKRLVLLIESQSPGMLCCLATMATTYAMGQRRVFLRIMSRSTALQLGRSMAHVGRRCTAASL
ncbi:MAG: hypothetical protein ACR2LM_12965 [Pyrinomonadaceae bacterium]